MELESSEQGGERGRTTAAEVATAPLKGREVERQFLGEREEEGGKDGHEVGFCYGWNIGQVHLS